MTTTSFIKKALVIFFWLITYNTAMCAHNYLFEFDAKVEGYSLEGAPFLKDRSVRMSFIIEVQEVNDLVGRRDLVEAVQNITFDYNNGEYVGTIDLADVSISDFGTEWDKVLAVKNLQGINFPEIGSYELVSSEFLTIETNNNSDLLKGARLKFLETGFNIGETNSTISLSWQNPSSPNAAPGWLVSRVTSLSITKVNY